MPVGRAVFTAVGKFSGLTGPADKAAASLDRVKQSAKGVGGAVPASGGQSGAGLQSISSRAGQLSEKLGNTGRSMTTGVTLPIVGGAALAIKSFADFELSIVSAGQKAGASSAQLERMSDMAVDLGAKTKFSASEAAQGMDMLAAAGFDAEEVMQALPGVMDAAQASGEGLALTADVVAGALNAFGLKASDSSKVADVLAQSANTTSLSMQDLQVGLANAGEVGPRFGQSLESVVAWMGRLRDMGVPAASAGTAIRQSLTSLSAPTNKAAGYLEDLGIKTRDAKGEMLPIPELLGNFQSAFDESNPKFKAAADAAGMTGAEYEDFAMKAIFGVEGAKAFSLALSDGKPIVLDAQKNAEKLDMLQAGLAETMGGKAAAAWIKARTENGKFTATGADAVKALTAMGTASEGMSKKFGEAYSETTTAKLDELMGSLESLGLILVDAVAPALKDVVDAVSVAVEAFGKWAKANPEMAKMVVTLLLIAAAIGPIAMILSKVFGAISLVTGGMGKMAAAAKFAFGKGPAGQASRFARAFDTIRLKAMAAAGGIRRGATAFVGWITAGARMAAAGARAFATWIANAARAAARGVATAARVVAAWVVAGVRVAASGLRAFATWIANAARAAAAMVANAARIAAQWTLMSLKALAAGARMAVAWTVGIIAGAARAAATMAITAARVVAAWVLMGIQSLLQAARMAAAWLIAMGPIGWIIIAIVALAALIIANWDRIKAWTIAAWTAIVAWVKSAWSSIKSAVAAAANWVATKVSAIWNSIKAKTSAVWNSIKSFLSAAWSGIKSLVSAGINFVLRIVTSVMNRVRSFWTSVWNGVKSTASSIWNGIKSLIRAGINAVLSVVTSVMNNIRSRWSSVWNGIKSFASSVWNSIKSLVSAGINRVLSVIRSVLSSIRSRWSSVWNGIRSLASSIWNGIKSVISNAINGVRSVISNVLNSIRSTWNSIWDGFKSKVSSVWNGIKGIISGVVGSIQGMISSISGKWDSLKAKVSKIPGAGLLGMRRGGLVPGHGSGDRVPALLEPGEFVLTKSTVQRVGIPAIASLNRRGGGGTEMLDKTKVAGLRAMSSSLRASEAGRAAPRPVATIAATASSARPSFVDNSSEYNITTHVYNPTAEKASDSVQTRLTRTAQLGLIGGRRSNTNG